MTLTLINQNLMSSSWVRVAHLNKFLKAIPVISQSQECEGWITWARGHSHLDLWGNFSKYGINVHLDWKMNSLDFGVQSLSEIVCSKDGMDRHNTSSYGRNIQQHIKELAFCQTVLGNKCCKLDLCWRQNIIFLHLILRRKKNSTHRYD